MGYVYRDLITTDPKPHSIYLMGTIATGSPNLVVPFCKSGQPRSNDNCMSGSAVGPYLWKSQHGWLEAGLHVLRYDALEPPSINCNQVDLFYPPRAGLCWPASKVHIPDPRPSIGRMEKKMETTILGYIWVI